MFCNKIDLGFILTSLKGLMGCFLGCFRVKDDKKPQFHRISDVNYSKDGDWMSGDNMATLFLSQETDSCSSDHRSTEFPFRDIDGKALKDEAKFLKACGTLLETPAEIRKTSEKAEGSPSHGGDYKNSEFKSWSPITPIRKLHLEDQSDCVPATADIHYEEPGHESGSPQVSVIRSIISEEQEAASRKGSEIEIPFLENGVVNLVDNDNVSAVTPVHPSVAIKSKIKSVRFEVQADTEPFSSRSLLSETGAQNVELSDSSGSESGSNKYSYPTPINITDDMQTPGTIYPPSQKNLASGKKSRIRSQYVQSVLKPIDNILQWKALKKEDLNAKQQLQCTIQSLEEHENANPERTSISRAMFRGRFHSRNSDMDRTILGNVASHWNYDEPSHISYKLLAGNGIPNSNKKYKEDQKVSWHATPFEERLEKALSEETHIPERKFLSGRPIQFDENDECFSS